MLTKFLDSKNDLAFKRVSDTEQNQDILIDFLKDSINHQGIRELQDITVGPSVPDSEIISQNKGIVQVLCQDKSRLECLGAMYVAERAELYQQSRYYAAAIYDSPLKNEANPQKFKGRVSLSITNFNMFPGDCSVRSEHVYMNTETLKDTLEDCSSTLIELSKFTKKVEELTDITETWYYYLRHAPEVYAKLVKDPPSLQQAYQELEASS